MADRDSGGVMDVRDVAHLARMNITDEEEALFQSQLGQVLQHVRELSELNLDGVEPTAHAVAVNNVFRIDEERPGLPHELVMANAPQPRNGLFIVPRILE